MIKNNLLSGISQCSEFLFPSCICLFSLKFCFPIFFYVKLFELLLKIDLEKTFFIFYFHNVAFFPFVHFSTKNIFNFFFKTVSLLFCIFFLFVNALLELLRTIFFFFLSFVLLLFYFALVFVVAVSWQFWHSLEILTTTAKTDNIHRAFSTHFKIQWQSPGDVV